MAPMVLDRYPNFRRLAGEVESLSVALLDEWPHISQADVATDPLEAMIRFTWACQTERLQALFYLDDRGLVHVGTPFVRIGYAEIIWLAYFAAKIQPGRRSDILRILAGAEVAQRFESQLGFLGLEQQKAYGFAAAAFDELREQEPQVKEDLSNKFESTINGIRGASSTRGGCHRFTICGNS